MEVSLTSLNRKRGLCTLGGGPRRGLGMGVLLSHSHSGYRKEPQWGLERWLRQILVPNRGLSGVGCGNLEEVGVTSVVWGRGSLNGGGETVVEIPELTGQQSSPGFRKKLCLFRGEVGRVTVGDNEHRPLVSPGKYAHKHVYTSLRSP